MQSQHKTEAQLPLSLPHRVAMSRDHFFVSASNRDAVAWLDHWPDWPTPCLVIHGPEGCGKTHLSAVWQQMSGAQRIALCSYDSDPVADQMLAQKGLIIEDAAPSVSDREHAEALLHLYNICRDYGAHLLLTAEKPVSEWDIALPDLESRLKAAVQVAVDLPDDELLSAILHKLFHDRQLHVKSRVIHYILPRMERSFAAAQSLVAQLDMLALAEGRAITVPLVKKAIESNMDKSGSAC